MSKLVLLLLFISPWLFAETLVYPRPESARDPRTEYPVALLQLALDHLDQDYQLQPSRDLMVQSRALRQLEAGTLSVVWSMTSIDREQSLLPIRIPIYKGLIGWRLPLIHQGKQEQVSELFERQGLKGLIAGQGHDWPDFEIIKANNFPVVGVSTYDSLFSMLVRDRIDYFPRSVIEIWDELSLRQASGIALEQTFALHYPTAFYYFVSPERPDLAVALERGLRAAIADGSFDQLFWRWHGDSVLQAELNRRHVIEMQNPILPVETPLTETSLWYQVGP